MKLIVGLGNPGRGYAGNRHNAGFMCLSHFARTQGIKLNKKQGKARIGGGEVVGVELVLARPQTYMNQSGQSVKALARKFKVSPGDIIIVHDDLDLPPGKIRIRRGGGSAGHKGVASVVAELGSREFVRVRVGIGRPVASDGSEELTEEAIVDYVLGDFAPEEKLVISRAIPVVGEAILCLLAAGLEIAMNKYNRELTGE